jgi:hypothetical protein
MSVFGASRSTRQNSPYRHQTRDLIGRRVNKLVVLYPAITAARSGRYWTCRCDCGGKKDIAENSILDYSAKSCGCIGAATTHGLSHTREHNIWRGMLKRCENPNATKYELYGGRGIKVCNRWQKFENFYADMGPSNGLTIDRIDGNGDYEPGNCRWATPAQQMETSRQYTNYRKVVIDGKEVSQSEAARHLGISRQAMHARLKKSANRS